MTKNKIVILTKAKYSAFIQILEYMAIPFDIISEDINIAASARGLRDGIKVNIE